MNSREVTREILWNVPLWARALMYGLFAVSAAVCVYGILRRVRVWRQGQPEPSASTLPESARRLVTHAIRQIRIWRSPTAGLAHYGIFWGFVVLFIGTCIVALEDYGSALLGRRPLFFYGSLYQLTSAVLEVFGIAFIAGLLIALMRRWTDASLRPLARPVDFAVLGLFLLIGVTGFVVEGLRIAGTDPNHSKVFEKCSFVGWGLSLAFTSWSQGAIVVWHRALWLVHMTMSMAFITAIPYCKLRHLFFSPLNVALAAPSASGVLKTVSLEEVELSGRFGVAEPSHFTWRQLLSFDACTQCARCQTVCPAHATGKPLSPMQVVMSVADAAGNGRKLHGEAISADALWACTTCGACVHECPVLIDQPRAIVDMRRHLVGDGQIRGSEQKTLRSISASGNPWGLPASDRMAWAQGLNVPTIEEEPHPEILFWVGCAGSYDRRSQKVTRAMVRIMQAAGIRFAVLGTSERCTGDPARRMGDEFTYQEAASANVETLNRAGVRRIVTACPHCFNTIGNEYPQFGGKNEVVHHTQLINELLRSSKLQLDEGAGQRIVFHDSCYLGRHNGEYDAPRDALKATGATVVEPAETRERGFCCGAGGGRMWMEESLGTRINVARWNQLKASAPQAVAVACPFCMTMMSDAAGAEDSPVAVQDVAEIIAAQLPAGGTV